MNVGTGAPQWLLKHSVRPIDLSLCRTWRLPRSFGESNNTEALKSPPTIQFPSSISFVSLISDHRISVNQRSGLFVSFMPAASGGGHRSLGIGPAGEWTESTLNRPPETSSVSQPTIHPWHSAWIRLTHSRFDLRNGAASIIPFESIAVEKGAW